MADGRHIAPHVQPGPAPNSSAETGRTVAAGEPPLFGHLITGDVLLSGHSQPRAARASQASLFTEFDEVDVVVVVAAGVLLFVTGTE
jgi:hypothetical protein